MKSNFKSINVNSLSQSRAEEFGLDLYKDFVLPPIYQDIDFTKSSQPKIFVGGRGCGKTMLLRYLSHDTIFSKSKEKIQPEDFENIGLYWKADTHIVHQLQKRGLPDDIWMSAFEHFLTVQYCLEVIRSMENIASSNYEGFTIHHFEEKLIYHPFAENEYKISLNDLATDLKRSQKSFQIWLKNVRTGSTPSFYPLIILKDLIYNLKENFTFLKNTRYNLYVDEFENLVEYQQRQVNTFVKHSEFPIIFHLAMKRNAFGTRETVGPESLSHVHDYRMHDLEEYFETPRDFKIFAAEIILYRLKNQHQLESLRSVDFEMLIDPDKQENRRGKAHQTMVLNIINQIFPSSSSKELANQVLDDRVLKSKLLEKFKKVLSAKNSKISADSFFYLDDMRVTFVCLCLLQRENIQADDLLREIKKLKLGNSNKFTNSTGWVNNNFIGSYLYFYSNLNRICPLYAGFDTFCLISNGNIRHLTELCYKTFIRAADKNSTDKEVQVWNIETLNQAQAAKQASATFLNEVKTFGRHGNQLHTFVLRLGTLFSLAHKNPKQSEPEQNHFSISKGDLKDDFTLILGEAVKWSVLFEQKSTKKKSSYNPDVSEYVLNPIYAPYFHISYRKKRKIELTENNFQALIKGSLGEYENLLKSFKQQWNIDQNDDQGRNLFSDLKI